ncbi:MAG: CDP-diacylglycerol--serine O-phosphatidyltransferase [Polyangiaceae bacterium]|nr:CDP-diacylglycerol--serine O-phosphatidyltransferase [Polyangiaceae bacterium]
MGRPNLRRRRPRRLDLRKTLFVVPNLLTLCSVFCGFNAILTVSRDSTTVDDLYRAAIILIFAMFFDLVDGRVARLTKTQSSFGLQLDSLADVISFGVAPALLVYKWVLFRYPNPGIFVGFLFVGCAAVRLARFNVLASDVSGAPAKPGKYIIGLPTPPASGILISLLVANHAMGGALGHERYTLILFGVTILLSLLMVSNVRFRSFKDLRLNVGTVSLLILVVGSSIFIWQRYNPQFVLVWLLGAYVAIGLIETVRSFFVKLKGTALPPSRDSVPPPVAG